MGSKRSMLGWPRYDLVIYFVSYGTATAPDTHVCPITISIPQKKGALDLVPGTSLGAE